MYSGISNLVILWLFPKLKLRLDLIENEKLFISRINAAVAIQYLTTFCNLFLDLTLQL